MSNEFYYMFSMVVFYIVYINGIFFCCVVGLIFEIVIKLDVSNLY